MIPVELSPGWITAIAGLVSVAIGFIAARATARTETSTSYAALVAALETRLKSVTGDVDRLEARLADALAALSARSERIAQLEARVRHLEDVLDRIPDDVLERLGIDPDDFLGGLI